jgi:hypothetical protein
VGTTDRRLSSVLKMGSNVIRTSAKDLVPLKPLERRSVSAIFNM